MDTIDNSAEPKVSLEITVEQTLTDLTALADFAGEKGYDHIRALIIRTKGILSAKLYYAYDIARLPKD